MRERAASCGLLRQPRAVRATADASVVAFMGIGLVDPILPSIAQGLDATASQVSLLFTSYFLITGFVSSRIAAAARPCCPASRARPTPSPNSSARRRAGAPRRSC